MEESKVSTVSRHKRGEKFAPRIFPSALISTHRIYGTQIGSATAVAAAVGNVGSAPGWGVLLTCHSSLVRKLNVREMIFAFYLAYSPSPRSHKSYRMWKCFRKRKSSFMRLLFALWAPIVVIQSEIGREREGKGRAVNGCK